DAADASIAELTDLAFVLARDLADRSFAYRAAIIAQAPEALVSSIEKAKAIIAESEGEEIAHVSVDRKIWIRTARTPSRIAFVFPGQGSQQLNAAKVLVKRFAWARELVASADRWMAESGGAKLSS